MRDNGNSVLIVEHDEAIMRAADHIVDLGPGAGENGGHVVATGTVDGTIFPTTSIYSYKLDEVIFRKVICFCF